MPDPEQITSQSIDPPVKRGSWPGEPRPTARQPFTKRHRPVIKLLTETSLTISQIASLTGVSENTVSRVRKILKLNGLGDRVPTGLEKYQRLLQKTLSDAKRAATLSELAKQTRIHPFAAIGAVKYVDSVLGFAPEQQQQADQQPTVRPMFSFAAGSQVMVSVHTPGKRNSKRTPAIDVTADKEPDA